MTTTDDREARGHDAAAWTAIAVAMGAQHDPSTCTFCLSEARDDAPYGG